MVQRTTGTMQGKALYLGMVVPPMPGVQKQLSGSGNKTLLNELIRRL
jgi:hypothetical protein